VPHLRRSSRLVLALSLLAGLGFSGAAPARAVETLALKLPVIGELITARVSELKSQQALWAGDSDLAELNRATDGKIAAAIWELVHTPMPTVDYQGSAMVQQIELMLSQLLEIDQQQASALHGRPLAEALQRLRSNGQTASLVNVLAEVHARKVVIRLDWAVPRLRDLQREQRALKARLAALPPLAPAPTSSLRPGAQPVTTTVSQIPLPGGADRLEVTVVRPTGTPTLPPVVISHGLWDSPASFLGWARHLASHGAPVFLPRHPGSDLTQQAEMLAGRVPPPDPREFLRRPADVRAVLDALDAGTLRGGEGIRAKGVVMIGHSWGATTALQLAGARSLQDSRWQECANNNDPQRNISWVLQCSFLPAATPESQADPRIVRAVAVSPPQGLVFVQGIRDLRIPVLLVSGSSDFVVPTRPEALETFPSYPRGGSELVVAEGGTHFNLPAGADSGGGPLRALLLRWVEGPALPKGTGLSDPGGLPLRRVPQAAAAALP